MSAGDLLAGEGLAGDDDLEPAVDPAVTRAVAIHFDGTTRDFPRDESGHYIGIHPVDAEMQMVCMLALGSVGGSPTTGNAIRGFEHIDPLRIDAQVKDEIRLRTKSLVDRGDVMVVEVRTSTFGNGGLVVEVDYLNNRLPNRGVQTARAGG